MKKLIVLGGGESGVGTAILGKQKGYAVFVSDRGTIKNNYREVLKHFDIHWEEQQHSEAVILKADVVVKSPGIPDNVPLIQKLIALKIPVISEIEFAAHYTNAMLIGITGSNGKTTTTMLTHQLLKNDISVGVAGNIGDSFAKQVAQTDYQHYVLELSSFQLDGIVDFKPHIAVITNITEDHLDRYDNKFEQYIDAKFRITRNQTKEDYLIYDADDEVITAWLANHTIAATLLPFSMKKKVSQGAYLDNDIIIVTTNKNIITMPTSSITLEGKHNIKNAMAAATVAQLVNIRKETIRKSLSGFHGVEHRLEQVCKIQNVKYINDSKATNVNATFYALDSMKQPTIWIVGGVDKGNDYSELYSLVNEKVKAIICLGTDNTKLIKAFKNTADILVETHSMQEAVKVAYRLADKGDSVLLSPACASFDLFDNYEDRGNQFKAAVRSL